MRASLALVLAACGGSATTQPGWIPVIAHSSPAGGRPIAVPFPDGTIGTELVLSILSQARQAGATALTNIQLQVGHCVRDISVDAVPALVDPVTFVTTESDMTCARHVDLYITDAPAEGFKFHAYGFRDTEMREQERCETHTITRAVTRERTDMLHRFVPPHWDYVGKWTGLPLHAGPVRCDAPDDKNEVRMVVHLGDPVTADAKTTPAPTPTAAQIVLAVQRKDGAGALELWKRASFEAGQPPELGKTIAEALFLVVDADTEKLLAAPVPEEHGAAWMDALDAQMSALQARYLRIGDVVLAAEAKPWLERGAERLAELHRHVGDQYKELGREAAAEKQYKAADRLHPAR